MSALSPFMSVRDLRAALEGAPDEAQIVVMVSGQEDQGVFAAWQSTLIPWSHDCTDAPDSHRPGRDCPTVTSFEIHVEAASEAGDTEFAYAVGNGGSPFPDDSDTSQTSADVDAVPGASLSAPTAPKGTP